MWFPAGKHHSFWDYFNKINIESENTSATPIIKRFLARQTTPRIVQNEKNMKNVEYLKQLDAELTRIIRSSDRKCCCFHLSEIIFGRHD